jgi:hypothetical protein
MLRAFAEYTGMKTLTGFLSLVIEVTFILFADIGTFNKLMNFNAVINYTSIERILYKSAAGMNLNLHLHLELRRAQ